ncbi:MAG: CoA pyrophosphatase [Brumimicrobium sp.]
MSLSIKIIQSLLEEELPGEQAHLEMSPLGRTRSSEAIKNAKFVQNSAVALVLYQTEETLKSILIQRPIYKGNHSGQVCLPGGKKEDFETNLEQTAIRECIEETGLIRNHLNLLGALTPVYIPVSNHHVQPYVFSYSTTPDFVPDPREVAEIIPFNIKDILEVKKIQTTDIRITNEHILKQVPYYEIQQKVVWGATAIILHEFKVICERWETK